MGRIKEIYNAGLELGFTDAEITSTPVSNVLFEAARRDLELERLRRELHTLRTRHATEVAELNSKLVVVHAKLVTAAIDLEELEAVHDELVETRRSLGDLEIENAVLRERLSRREQDN